MPRAELFLRVEDPDAITPARLPAEQWSSIRSGIGAGRQLSRYWATQGPSNEMREVQGSDGRTYCAEIRYMKESDEYSEFFVAVAKKGIWLGLTETATLYFENALRSRRK